MKVPFARPLIGEAERLAVEKVLASGWLTSGAVAADLEDQISSFVGVDHAVALNSCTAALHLALVALDIQAGDEVIVPSLTFAATAEVVVAVGATPVLVDVDPSTLCISPGAVAAAVTVRSKAIIAMHYGGRSAPMEEISAVAKRHSLAVIEDAAHALPTEYNGRLVGSCEFSDVVCLSFYANKTMTTGEGGMLLTNDESLARRVRSLSLHGLSRDAWRRWDTRAPWDYVVQEPGWKYNLPDLSAAVGVAQFAQIQSFATRRREIAMAYDHFFSERSDYQPLPDQGVESHAAHLYVVRCKGKSRDDLIAGLAERGIGTSVHYRPLHLQPAYTSEIAEHGVDLSVSDDTFHEICTLPSSHSLRDDELQYVLKSLEECA